MHYLLANPIAFINSATPLEAHVVIFCAMWIPWLTILWVLIFLLYRPIPNKNIFAPFENIASRIKSLFLVCFTTVIAYAVSVVFKNYFRIGRPEILNLNLHPLIHLSDYGFPSSHATVFSAIAVSLFFINRRSGLFVGILALIIGIARIYAGVHTPLDILGGYLLGTIVACLVGYIDGKIRLQKR